METKMIKIIPMAYFMWHKRKHLKKSESIPDSYVESWSGEGAGFEDPRVFKVRFLNQAIKWARGIKKHKNREEVLKWLLNEDYEFPNIAN